MYSLGLFLIQILIIAVFVILFLLIKYNKINMVSAFVLLVLSITTFVFLPSVNSKWGFVPTVIILILFVLFGMELVIMLEERKFTNLKFENVTGFFNLGKLMKKFDFSQRFRFIDSIMSFKKVDEIKKTKEDNTLVFEKQEKTRTFEQEQDIYNSLISNETISYVDFEKKGEQHGDVFSKFIRGEIPASEVRERISRKTIEEVEKSIVQPVKEKEFKNEVKKSPKKSKKKNAKGIGEIETVEGSEKGMTVEQCIDSAFAAKTEGKYVEAIEYYIQALEKKPEEQLILWIIIDVCSLYRELGQESLAKEMIQSYIETAGNSISQEIKDDLTKNFGI